VPQSFEVLMQMLEQQLMIPLFPLRKINSHSDAERNKEIFSSEIAIKLTNWERH